MIRSPPGKSGTGWPDRTCLDQPRDVEARGVADAAPRRAHGRHDAAPRVEEVGGPGADVAEALDGEPPAAHLARAGVLQVLLEREDGPAAGRLLAAERAEEVDWLAGHHRGREAVDPRVLVHDPRHHLGVGVRVGRGDVGVRPDHVVDLVDEPAREPLELARGQGLRVDGDAALGAPVREVDHGGLPRHQRGEAERLVEIDGRMVAKPALHRPAAPVVLDPVAGEGGQLAAVARDRQLDLDLAVGRDQELLDAGREVHPAGGLPEVVVDRLDARHARIVRRAASRRRRRLP